METEIDPLYENITQVEDYIIRFLDHENLVDQWVLTQTPYPMLILLFLYFLFVLRIGPSFMENRAAYDLNTVMRVYNICQVLANVRLLYYPIIYYHDKLPYILQLSCAIPKDTDDSIDELRFRFLHLFHGYTVLKMMDLLDTVFMVLRKKNSQITFLHLYHHGIMVFGSWFTLKYLKSLQSILPGMINVIVHTVMYSYFFLATFGEPMKKYLWWKKYLTKLQLAQFVFDLMYIFSLYYNGCPISKAFTYFWSFNAFVFFCLFLNFYVKEYIVKSTASEKKKNIKKD